jgi:hypothetical protein
MSKVAQIKAIDGPDPIDCRYNDSWFQSTSFSSNQNPIVDSQDNVEIRLIASLTYLKTFHLVCKA